MKMYLSFLLTHTRPTDLTDTDSTVNGLKDETTFISLSLSFLSLTGSPVYKSTPGPGWVWAGLWLSAHLVGVGS